MKESGKTSWKRRCFNKVPKDMQMLIRDKVGLARHSWETKQHENTDEDQQHVVGQNTTGNFILRRFWHLKYFWGFCEKGRRKKCRELIGGICLALQSIAFYCLIRLRAAS
jgi:hypothetical protein